MTNVTDMFAGKNQEEKQTAEAQATIDGGLLQVDAAIMMVLDAIEDQANALEYANYQVDSYRLLASINALYESLGRDPRESQAYILVRDICDYLEISEELNDD